MSIVILERQALKPTKCILNKTSLISQVNVPTIISDITPRCPREILSLPQKHFLILEHELSNIISKNSSDSRIGELRSFEEHRTLEYWRTLRKEAMESPTKLGEALEDINSMILGKSSKIRNTDAYIIPGADSVAIRFPNASVLQDQLYELHTVLSAEIPTFVKAVITLAVVTNAHFFNDGNGRIGRLLFNDCFHIGGMANTRYIPFFEAVRRSRGGYHIALRLAEIAGDWRPIMSFCGNLITVTNVERNRWN